MAPAISIVTANSSVQQAWLVDCEHGIDALTVRIPLRHINALDGNPEATPIFQQENFRSGRPCFQDTPCFRAVHDDFISDEEADALWNGLEPEYGRGESTGDGEKFIAVWPQMFRAGLLGNITSRMADYLVSEHGARGVRVSHRNSRGEWRFPGTLHDGALKAAQRQGALRQGRLKADGHIDAARPVQWHYTVLLYVGHHGADRFAGGETLLIDSVEPETGHVSSGVLVEPRRGRVLAFSSGSENVHMALQVTYGYRSIMQFWFTCEPRKPRITPDETAAARLEL